MGLRRDLFSPFDQANPPCRSVLSDNPFPFKAKSPRCNRWVKGFSSVVRHFSQHELWLGNCPFEGHESPNDSSRKMHRLPELHACLQPSS
jgi:hypothetical protein